MKKIILIPCLVVLLCGAASAHCHPERWHAALWCVAHGGDLEIHLPDGTRCDCVTATHAVEVEFAAKWPEAIGQALYYSLQTGKRAGVALIVEREGELRFWIRLNSVIQWFGLSVDTWLIESP